MNPHDENERYSTMLACSFKSTRAHFSHLSMRQMISPPKQLLDAALARQVAIHVFLTEFGVPRRRGVATLGVARSTIAVAMRVIEDRRMEPVFNRAYHRIASRASDLYMAEMARAQEAA